MNESLPSFSSHPEPTNPEFMAGFPKPGDRVIVKRTDGNIDRDEWTIHQMPDLTPFMAPEVIEQCRVIVKAPYYKGGFMTKAVTLKDLLEWQTL